MTLLSVENILEQGNVTFSNSLMLFYKYWFVCGCGLCVMNTVCQGGGCLSALHCCKMCVTCDDVRCTCGHKILNKMYFFRKHKCPCVLHLISADLKCKSHISSPPLWNAAPSTHSQPICIKTVQFHINNPKHAAFNKGCDW